MEKSDNEENVGVKKPKKKKKHRFLKFILTILILVVIWKGIKYGITQYAQKELEKKAPDIPVTGFSINEDNLHYITGDFKLLDFSEDKFTWSCSSEAITIEGTNAKVKRPAKQSINAVLSLNNKILFANAHVDYPITIIKENVIDKNAVRVITKEMLRDEQYYHKMELRLDENSNVTSMYGDFTDIYVYSKEDGESVINAYKESFNIDQNIEFRCVNYQYTDVNSLYEYAGYIGDVRLDTVFINLSVNSNNFKLKNIDCKFDRINYSEFDISHNTYSLEQYEEKISNEAIESDVEFEILNTERLLTKDGKTVDVLKVIYDNLNSYSVIIDVESGKILEFYSTSVNVSESLMEPCKGYDELNNLLEFEASNLTPYLKDENSSPDMYALLDDKRQILIERDFLKNNIKDYSFSKLENEENIGWKIVAIISGGIDLVAKSMVTDDDSFFEKETDRYAVNVYCNFQQIYDWYKNKFGRISFDNNGARIIAVVNSYSKTDNAAYIDNFKIFQIGNCVNFSYTLGQNRDVLCHEFTHAVFNSFNKSINDNGVYNGVTEVNAINEAYADVMACLMSGKWTLGDLCIASDYSNSSIAGKSIVLRNIAMINSADSFDTLTRNETNPEKYYSEDWFDENGALEEHRNSVVASHIAWMFHNSDSFSDNDIARIWYQSLSYGYNVNSTMVTYREHILKAMEDLGYSLEKIEIAQGWFDDMNILDTVEKCMGIDKSVEGDLILDNTSKSKFLIVKLQLLSNETSSPIYIYEGKKKPNKSEIEYGNAKIQELIRENGWNETTLLGTRYEIKYEQAGEFILDEACEIFDEIIYNYVDPKFMNSNDGKQIKSLFKEFVDYRVVECTPYELYESLGLFNTRDK